MLRRLAARREVGCLAMPPRNKVLSSLGFKKLQAMCQELRWFKKTWDFVAGRHRWSGRFGSGQFGSGRVGSGPVRSVAATPLPLAGRGGAGSVAGSRRNGICKRKRLSR